jgi:hypothetical protein
MSSIAPLDLERAPTATVCGPGQLFGAPVEAVTASASPPPEARAILESVARFVGSRRISLVAQFKYKNRFSHNRVPPTPSRKFSGCARSRPRQCSR